MTKKGHQKFFPSKWNFFQSEILVREKFVRPSKTRRQVSAPEPT